MQISFVTARFDVTTPGLITYGADAANWMRAKLKEVDIDTSEPGLESWGCYMTATYESSIYLLSFTGRAEGEDEQHPNMGVWILLFEKYRTRLERLLRQNKLHGEDPVLTQIARILQMEKEITYLGAR